MNRLLKEKIRESLSSVMPITVVVLILSILIIPMEIGMISMFLLGALFMVLGMGFFSLGSDMAMTQMGEGIGAQFSKTNKLTLIIIIAFVMGVIITIAEPDLQVLADQVPAIPDMILILTVAAGVGIFLAIAILRTLFRISLSKLLLVFYAIVFSVSIFVPKDFLAVAFDSGGVTTGPITVPFIMAIGIGLAAVRSDKNASDDSFGLVALCSIGPILAVMTLGIFYNPSDASYTPVIVPEIITMRDLMKEFAIGFPHYLKEVVIALTPVLGVFTLFQIVTRRFQRRQIYRIAIGFIYTLLGLALFLTGVNVGFIAVGSNIGSQIAGSDFSWILVPLGMIIGYFIVAAEPAVHVLNKQVEDISEGLISQSSMMMALSLGVAASVGLAMIRILTGISIYWFLIPGYAIALLLTFFVPKMFIGIAFDSGGVASGAMASTFLIPLAIGACEAVGGEVMVDAFGVVAMVAMTPLIAIQVMGLMFMRKEKSTVEPEIADIDSEEMEEIIDFEEDTPYE